jgi:hypothetical protein
MADLYCFNPTNEIAVANGTASWQAKSHLIRFERDLELLAALLGNPTDVALVYRVPSNIHIAHLQKFGIALPTLLPFSIPSLLTYFETNTIDFLRPWGWSPSMLSKLKPLFPFCCSVFLNSPAARWGVERRDLYSRITALEVLKRLLALPTLHGIILEANLPHQCQTLEQVQAAHSVFQKSVLKAPWSSSGRGVQPLNPGSIHPSILNWCRGILTDQGYVMLEPWHLKVADFSLQFDYKNNEAHFIGISFFETDDQGRYLGNWLHPKFEGQKLEAYLFINKQIDLFLPELRLALEQVLGCEYEGHLGVDAMVIEENGEFRIHPCVEINLRFNMGLVALKLADKVGNTFNLFRIIPVQQLKERNSEDYFLLTEVHAETQVCAILTNNV